MSVQNIYRSGCTINCTKEVHLIATVRHFIDILTCWRHHNDGHRITKGDPLWIVNVKWNSRDIAKISHSGPKQFSKQLCCSPAGCCAFLLAYISGYLGGDYGKLIGHYFYDLMEWAPCSGSRDVGCGQKKVESVTGARFTQSDSGDSNPICFGRRGCSQWFGCDWSFPCPWSHHDTIPVSTFIFPLLT